MPDAAAPAPGRLSGAWAIVLVILLAPAILLLFLISLPSVLLEWVVLHHRDKHRWRGFWRNSKTRV